MEFLKCIIKKIKNFNKELGNNGGVTWMEYRRQWLKENNIKCK